MLTKEKFSSYHPLAAKLLERAGVKTEEEALRYLNPDYYRDLHDPFLLADMDKAVERLLLARERGEKVVILGDYDADGIPASALLSDFFKQIGQIDFDVYIPDRHNEDYGLSDALISKFHDSGVKLIITIDCGTTDVAEITRAKELGIDTIVLDHHLVPEVVPPAVALVNPKRPDDHYPEKMLCGAGVAFKFVQALIARGDFGKRHGFEKWFLDLVAIATVSDMVPLTGENRVLAYFGLKVLRQTRRLGLQAMFDELGLKSRFVGEDDIGFSIGPRLNSASRMSHSSQAFFLLATDKEDEAKTIARHLEEKNAERRAAVDKIFAEIKNSLDENNLPPIITCGGSDWNPGVLGLVSSRVVENFDRPAFIWVINKDRGEAKGSCRSDGRFNVVELMKLVGGEKFFNNFGGHVMAGGFSAPLEKIDDLPRLLLEVVPRATQIDPNKKIEADYDCSLNEIGEDLWQVIEKLGPYGIDNKKPILALKNIEITEARTLGNGGLHLELTFNRDRRQPLKAIGFFSYPKAISKETVNVSADHIFGDAVLESGRRIDLFANLEKSYFRGRPELRLRIVDLKKAE